MLIETLFCSFHLDLSTRISVSLKQAGLYSKKCFVVAYTHYGHKVDVQC